MERLAEKMQSVFLQENDFEYRKQKKVTDAGLPSQSIEITE